MPTVMAKVNLFLPHFLLIRHDNLIAQQTSTSVFTTAGYYCGKKSNGDRQREGKGGTEITMFRCGEVKWTREREQS